jgi:hypothetical protein
MSAKSLKDSRGSKTTKGFMIGHFERAHCLPLNNNFPKSTSYMNKRIATVSFFLFLFSFAYGQQVQITPPG